jgi:formylglycine-generating enzyme required for sulfatase activity
MDQSIVSEVNQESQVGANLCLNLTGGAWVYVAKNVSVGQDQDFCLMKYEAKRDEDQTTPRSIPEGKPWAKINFDDAVAVCQKLGIGYSLTSNAMWQTVAREAEMNDVNWGTNGGRNHYASILNFGNAIIGRPFASSQTDRYGCFGSIGQRETNAASGCDWDAYKRTHLLADGSVIWDLAGNVAEWVDVKKPLEIKTSIHKYSRTLLIDEEKRNFGPVGDYKNKRGPHQGGLGYIIMKKEHNALSRGGFSGFGDGQTGIFTAISQDKDEELKSLGFRCAYATVP